MPAVVGLILTTASGLGPEPLQCLDNAQGVRPDGTIVYEHGSYKRGVDGFDRIAAVSPPPGALVSRDDLVTINLVPVDPNEPPAYHPCDWVTPAEAAGFLGGAPIDVSSTPGGWTTNMGNLMGSTEIGCDYHSPDHSHAVRSELRLTRAHIIMRHAHQIRAGGDCAHRPIASKPAWPAAQHDHKGW
jgi:hypothetical protein